jgi:hypothetical protein
MQQERIAIADLFDIINKKVSWRTILA